MTEQEFHFGLMLAIIAIGAFTFFILFFISAPYGRHQRAGWGPTILAKTGWVIMESPSVVLFAAIFFAGQHHNKIVPLLFFAMWITHYGHRTFIYPFRAGPSKKRMPIAVMVMAVVFNCCNAYVNARWISHFGEYNLDTLSWHLPVGLVIFLLGMWLNMTSDYTLLRMKKNSNGDYQIPRGQFFEKVSCPNYLGELMEWLGWAIACASLAGWSFFIFTFANLVPRARTHHQWYQSKFEDYPKQRRAIFPYVY